MLDVLYNPLRASRNYLKAFSPVLQRSIQKRKGEGDQGEGSGFALLSSDNLTEQCGQAASLGMH
jgi:hypothetical protein